MLFSGVGAFNSQAVYVAPPPVESTGVLGSKIWNNGFITTVNAPNSVNCKLWSKGHLFTYQVIS